MSRVAACTCGQLTAACEGEPVRISMCHCLECQRRTGSVFAVQARFPKERVTVSGCASEYTRVGDDGGHVTFRFCGTCSAIVWYGIDGDPGLVAVPVGAFADPSFPPPTYSVYESRRHGWAEMPSLAAERDA